MNYILKCILLLVVTFSNTLWSAEESADLRDLAIALTKLQDQIVGTKLIIDGKQTAYNAAVVANDAEEIEKTKASVEETQSVLASLETELYRIQAAISTIEGQNGINGIKTENTSTGAISSEVSSSKTLLPGWNTFAIPINKSLASSSPILGKYSSIWGYDSETNQWINNPETLLPGKGYFIHTTGDGYKLSFKGTSFSTNLDTIVKKSMNWYFLGASEVVDSVDYSKYVVLKYELQTYIKNPPMINTGDAFWAYRR